MRNIVIKYGLLASILIVGAPIVGWMIGGRVTDYSTSEVIGYSSIVVSMIFVFLGIKKFRDEVNQGNLSFFEAVKVGLLIAMIPSLGFGAYNHVYVEYLDPEFMDSYYQHSIDQMKGELSAEEFENHVANMEAQKEMFMNPVVSFIVMFLTVFIIGAIVTLISSLILRKESDVPAENLTTT